MNPQYASPQMVSDLRALWDVCFPGEGDTYCNLYFSRYFDPHHCCVILDESDKPISALYWFDGKLRTQDCSIPVVMLYAGCTAPEYRGYGNFTKMVQFVMEHCRRSRMYAIVLNALPTSRGACEKLGFVPAFYLQETMYNPSAQPAGIPFSACSLKTFSELRHTWVNEVPNSVYWDNPELPYMYADIWDSGAILQAEADQQLYYAVVTRKADHLLIRESSFPLRYTKTLIDGVCQAFAYSGPVKLQTRDGNIPYGTGYLSTQRTYFAHMLDILPHAAFQRLKTLDLPRPYLNLTAN